MTAKDWTLMLRRPDELSHVAMRIGMRAYQPDPAKAAHYAAQRRQWQLA